VIAGLSAAAGPPHIARAALESICWRVADIVEAIAEVQPVGRLRVDGGLTHEPALLQIQADALDVPLSVGPADATVLGAAMLAAVGAGVFASVEQAALRVPEGRVVTSLARAGERSRSRALWREFVLASATL
jgi:glycerol kinase